MLDVKGALADAERVSIRSRFLVLASQRED